MSKRETVLLALLSRLTTAGLVVERNLAVPLDIPAGGFLVLHDGTPGQPETTLSPLTYHYRHRAQLDLAVTAATGTATDAAFDVLASAVGAALAADRTLGGTCDWVEAEAPDTEQIAPDGAAPVKGAVIGIVLHYSTSDPLG